MELVVINLLHVSNRSAYHQPYKNYLDRSYL